VSETTLTLQAVALEDGSGWQVLCPAVGLYTHAPREGSAWRAGEVCARLTVLEQVRELALPEGIAGFVASSPPARRKLPVAYGDVLFELHRATDSVGFTASEAADGAEAEAGLVLRAPQAGRFYRRSSPDSPVFAEDGEDIQVGKTLGLLEVMKTFNPVKYQALGGLPAQAQIVRFLVEDSADVEEGQALIEVCAR